MFYYELVLISVQRILFHRCYYRYDREELLDL